ncbi:envelope stress response membrane protein PspB [Dongshaea marina]|uniref:envelope stress response membrane protein PspB n=1 Tax=Dongshaea marina TaxID=2047966 RepID=UPI0019024264|nr:envelope stress response membrane protein PspB [Dongshaea marina]
MAALLETLVVPLCIFLIIVAPVWLVLHYRSQRRRQEHLDKQSLERLDQLCDTGERLQHRVENLEALLDAELPGWRERHER